MWPDLEHRTKFRHLWSRNFWVWVKRFSKSLTYWKKKNKKEKTVVIKKFFFKVNLARYIVVVLWNTRKSNIGQFTGFVDSVGRLNSLVKEKKGLKIQKKLVNYISPDLLDSCDWWYSFKHKIYVYVFFNVFTEFDFFLCRIDIDEAI